MNDIRVVPSDEGLENDSVDAERLAELVAYCNAVTWCPRCPHTHLDPEDEATTLDTFLSGEGAKRNEYAAILGQIRCYGCGGELKLGDDVAVHHRMGRRSLARETLLLPRHIDRLSAFQSFLERHPYLGVAHDVGREIFGSIDSFKKTSLPDATWWRARKPEGPSRLGSLDMRPPDPEYRRSEGRFHHYGDACWYVASDPETAVLEVIDPRKQEFMAWVQECRIESVPRVLDLRLDIDSAFDLRVPMLAFGLTWAFLRNLVPDPDATWKPEYFIPRFIADCARQQAFSGIIFNSTRNNAENLVLFDPSSSLVSLVGDPQIIQLSQGMVDRAADAIQSHLEKVESVRQS